MLNEKCEQNLALINTEMNSWREEICPSPADTYIERCFEQKCKQLKNGFAILTEWRMRKRYYISILETISFDFQHFSRHDDSHSINILETIEMLLGKARIDMLSAGNLWLLLECAYVHDTGMAMNDNELRELWISDVKFREYIESALKENDNPNYEAARCYQQVDNLIRGIDPEQRIDKNKNSEDIFPPEWPIEFSRSISLLMADYIRSKHPDRVWATWNKRDINSDPIIPKRLDRTVQIASALHGRDFEKILTDLSYCCKGFGNGKIHPRFAAAMLRIGDILDIDNNRFNPRTVEHFGKLPYVNMLHYKKHEAITHLAIRESGIEVKSISEDLEVCKVLSEWFRGIENETKDLIYNWNEIVPEELKGCRLEPSKCEVYHETVDGGEQEFKSKSEWEFQVNKKKLINLLIGNSIYSSSMDFIREYLQNALDATKMQLWKDWESKKFKFSEDANQYVLEEELSPFDFGETIYNQYELQVEILLDFVKQKVMLSFIDHGIGMEQECVDVLAKVGTGWRGRKAYSDDIYKMPKWLQPTGGFGIGIQSAFMVTDKVIITTRDKNSNMGRKIILNSPEQSGTVIEEGSISCERGTTIKIELDLKNFFDTARIYQELAQKERAIGQNRGYEQLGQNKKLDFFNKDQIQEYLVDFLEAYIKVMIPGTFFPIRIVCPKEHGEISKIVKNSYFPRWRYWKKRLPEDTFYKRIEDGEEVYHFFLEKGKSEEIILTSTIWDLKKNICYYFLLRNSKLQKEMRVCFKNVLVKEEVTSDYQWIGRLDLLVDFMGFSAKEILKIHRDKLDENFSRDIEPVLIKNAYKIFFQQADYLRNINAKLIDCASNYLDSLDVAMLRLVYLKENIENIDMSNRKGDIFAEGILLTDSIPWEENGYPSDELFIKTIADFLQLEDKAIIVQTDKIVQKGYSIPERKINEWNELRSKEVGDKKRNYGNSDKILTFLDRLKEASQIIITGRYADLLLDLPMVDQVPFIFENKGVSYALLFKKKIFIENNERKIFELSYTQAVKREEHFIAKNVRKDFFPDLQVYVIPFENRAKARNGMIISPIGANAYYLIADNMNVKKGKLKYELFTELIVQQDDYRALIKYVHNQQYKQGNFIDLQKIDAEYKKYIRKIHDVYMELP